MTAAPFLEPVDDTSWHLAAESYERSGRYVQDAIDWASTHAHEHAALADIIVDYYRDSPAFSTFVDDLLDGVVEL